ncbi:MAG: hypothetical protein H8E51_07060 [Bacteroidetes bacterium]|nr:hypothetical protein [Bacteroidota bacterium]
MGQNKKELENISPDERVIDGLEREVAQYRDYIQSLDHKDKALRENSYQLLNMMITMEVALSDFNDALNEMKKSILNITKLIKDGNSSNTEHQEQTG